MVITYDRTLLPTATITPSRLTDAVAAVQKARTAGELGFTSLPSADIQPILDLAAAVRSECEVLLVIGIGGSDLGTRAVHRALNHQFYNLLPTERRGGPRLLFVGDTTDPVALTEVLDIIDLKHTIVTVVSKSGNTIEQMSTFIYLRKLLIEAVGPEQAKQQIIVLTDPETGTLRKIVAEEGYRSLAIPPSVGGRFSVLSSVGLFPLAVVGVDIQALLDGARYIDEQDASGGAEEKPAALFALDQYLAVTERQQPISVLMPYVYGLRELGFWYRQLWAESLGKKVDRSGKVVESGPTPIAAVGPTDQHSQMQLYSEGPRDKVITFLRVEQQPIDITLPEAYGDKEGVAYLKDHTLSEIVAAEAESSALALAQDNRPNATLSIPKLDAYHLGALLYFFELATAYSGELYDINAFDQPGVELGKQLMYGLLGRPGFDAPAPVADKGLKSIY